MGIGNTFLLAQMTALILAFIVSFFVFVPMCLNLREFDGHCLLYATGTWDSNSSQLVQVDWGSSSPCNFSVFLGIAIMMLAVFYIVLNCIYLARAVDSSWLEVFVMMILTCLFTVMLFASSLTISVGFKKWCNLITSPQSQIASCELADFIQFDKELGNINARYFYTEMKMTEFGSWSSFLCWLFLAVTSVFKIIKFQQHESFMASVNRERQRLLQRAGRTPDYTI